MAQEQKVGQSASNERAQPIEKLISDFDSEASATLNGVDEAAGDMNKTAISLTAIAEWSNSHATGGAVTAIGSISDNIVKVSEIENSIPSAVEEQATVTSEIANNVEQTSSGTQSVTVRIADERKA